uniref:Homoserine kinase n=1 Tax=mine drainage metagenome TaxID=410659 RepID=E6QMB3_9ZZZZ
MTADLQKAARVRFRLQLPATSANLGAAFDAAAVALDFALELEAQIAGEFRIQATGRNAEECGRIDGNLILDSYCALLEREGRVAQPLTIRMRNEIPLGMGCGSSAAGRLAAVALAAYFGDMDWSGERILAEACALEGHPDNAAACWMGGLVIAAAGAGAGSGSQGSPAAVHAAQVTPPEDWSALLAMPMRPLATSHARAVLPDGYSRADAVANVQAAALLGLAFAQGRGDLVAPAMRDRMHQPYRAEICPLLGPLLPLTGQEGVLGVALSGAGPSVLLVIEGEKDRARQAVTDALGEAGLAVGQDVELLDAEFAARGASEAWSRMMTG